MAEAQTPSGSGNEALHRWRFADLVLDERSLELLRDGQPVPLHRKSMQVLLHLLQHAGEVVTKDELADACWPGRILSDTVLTTTLNRLRSVLGDESQSLIKTVHGYGYRLQAPVAVERFDEVPPARLSLRSGERPPLRPTWMLETRLGAGSHGEVWTVRQDKTGERRVCKFAFDASGLRAIKREITLFRMLKAELGERVDLVRVLDWNLEQAPFFIELEYLPCGSLLEWSVSAVPDRQVRLELIAQCAEALAAAHGVGVLHKDLKPANVLMVAAEGQSPGIKLTDFGSGGVLEAAHLHGITRLGFTATASLRDGGGTPLYLAPEVQAGQPSTVQGDVYSLGVMLYQAVIGDWKKPLAPGWEREIDDEVLRADIAAAVDGDPSRRLADAASLARRLRQLDARRQALHNAQCEAAQQADLQQRLQRAELRRRWTVALAAVLLLGLASTLALYVELLGANRARAAALTRAQAEAEAAQQVTAYVTSLFDSAAPEVTAGQALATRELVDRGREQLVQRFVGQPRVRVRLLAALGSLYCRMGLPQECRDQTEQALALQDTGMGADSDPLLRAELLMQLAEAVADQGLHGAAEGYLRRSLALREAQLPADDPRLAETLNKLGQSLWWQQRAGESLAVLMRARSVLSATPESGREHDAGLSITILGSLADSLYDAGRQDEALALAQQRIGRAKAHYGETHLRSYEALDGYGRLLRRSGRNREAEPLQREVIEGYLRFYGRAGLPTIAAYSNLGSILNGLGRVREAVLWLQQAVDAIRARGDYDSPDYALTLANLAQVQEQGGDYATSLPNQREAYVLMRKHHGDATLAYHQQRINLGRMLILAGQVQEAMPLLQAELPASLEGEQAQLQRGCRLHELGNGYVALGQLTRAAAAFDRAEAHLRAFLPPDHRVFSSIDLGRARMLIGQRRHADALTVVERALSAIEQHEHPESPTVLLARIERAAVLEGIGRRNEARVAIDQIRAAAERELSVDHPARAEVARLSS